MKKILSLFLVVGFISTTFAYTIGWASEDLIAYAPGDTDATGYTIQLLNYADDSVIATTTLSDLGVGAYLAGSYPEVNAGGFNVYSRAWNSDMSYYVDLGDHDTGLDYKAIPADSITPPVVAYNVAGAVETDWIAIPEPGTIILFGLGTLVIAARRKFRK